MSEQIEGQPVSLAAILRWPGMYMFLDSVQDAPAPADDGRAEGGDEDETDKGCREGT